MAVFADFVGAASPYVNLYGKSFVVPEFELARYWANKQRLAFLRDIIDRAAILEHCFESLNEAALALRLIDDRRASLQPDERGWRWIPPEMTEEEDRWARRVDAMTALIYYEFTSIVSMLRQLQINIDPNSEVNYLVKVRDRFLSHSRRDGVQRGRRGGGSLARRDVIALNQWSTDDLRALGRSDLVIGSKEWKALRDENEQRVRSKKQNEKFSASEITDLFAAGVREPDIDRAASELEQLLDRTVMPLVKRESNIAVEQFGMARYLDDEDDDSYIVPLL